MHVFRVRVFFSLLLSNNLPLVFYFFLSYFIQKSSLADELTGVACREKMYIGVMMMIFRSDQFGRGRPFF